MALYFPSPAAFREWLEANHLTATELLVGFHKAGTGVPSMTWTQSVREALCFGWIDGVRTRVDEARYTIRFSPRKATSIWSAVNVRHVEELTAAGLMREAGLSAYASRRENKVGVYSFEQRSVDLPEAYAVIFRRKRTAFTWFGAQPASYRKAAVWWVVSAKQEVTRARRLQTLMDCSAQKQWLPHMTKWR